MKLSTEDTTETLEFRVLVYATKTSGTANELLELITQYPGQRRPFFEEKTKASQRSLQRWLNQLQCEGKIEFTRVLKQEDIGK
ncbi:hypothetical protein [Olivibacter domesticus]|uniref:Uncharacterized protein n=1 Tax=Olivibacter domesticus TaxID=407022 RepID=A0A1H7Q104_OLID1|nr:hypothetical protein [Olivibacter domesticus]SEL41811.1 hypothetical protein SAMN05661044_02431 [Olivibacter domesticus]